MNIAKNNPRTAPSEIPRAYPKPPKGIERITARVTLAATETKSTRNASRVNLCPKRKGGTTIIPIVRGMKEDKNNELNGTLIAYFEPKMTGINSEAKMMTKNMTGVINIVENRIE